MNESERIISDFLAKKGLIISRYNKDEQRVRYYKTPDFKVYKEQQLIFSVKLKI